MSNQTRSNAIWLLLAFVGCSLLSSVANGQQRVLVTNSRLQLGTEENLSASVRAGDLDGDGDIDLVVANGRHWPQQNYVFLNDGKSRFSVMKPLGTTRSTSYAAELADLDGDGDLDVVTGNDMAPCSVFINDGQANFMHQTTLGKPSSVRSVTVRDVDGDDQPDIVVTCRGRPNRIHLQRDGLGFSEVLLFGTKRDSTIDVEVADFDGDERADLVLANRDGQSNAWLRRLANDRFETNIIKSTQTQSRAVAVADFNSDGFLDVAFGNIGAPNSVVLGRADGGFGSSINVGDHPNHTYCVAAADMDLDGDIDLVCGNVGAQNCVYFNQGDGKSYVTHKFGQATGATYGLCVADFDGDQFPDVAVANSGAANSVFLSRPADSSNGQVRDRAPTASLSGVVRTDNAVSQADESSVSKGDWPMFRGPHSRGISGSDNLPSKWNAVVGDEEHVVWRTEVPGLGHSSPIVVGERLLVATAVAKQGKAPLQVGRSGAPTAADDQGMQDWKLICYDKRSGQTLWETTACTGIPRATRHAKATHASSTLAVDGDHVIAFFGSEGLYCYDLEGKLRWKRDLGVINISKYGIGWGYASSPAIHDGRIILVCDDPSNPFVVALRLDTGEEIWRVGRQGDCERSWGSPFILDRGDGSQVQVVVNGWPSVISYDLETGDEIWRINGGGDNPVPTPFMAHGHIFITSAHGADAPIHAVSPDARGDITEQTKQAPNRDVLWSVSRGGCYMSTPVVWGDYLYLGNSNGVLRCFHAQTGQKIYEKRLGQNAGIIASLVAGDDKIYCASENGKVYVVEGGAEFRLIAENEMGSPCFATPAISDGVLFFRTTEELVAIQ